MAAGRPAKLNSATAKLLCEAMLLGHTYAEAAAHARVGESTLYRWLQTGRTSKSGKCREFAEAFERAESEGIAALYRIVRTDANGRSKTSVQSARWILEKRRPDEYGERVKVLTPDLANALARIKAAPTEELIREYVERTAGLLGAAGVDRGGTTGAGRTVVPLLVAPVGGGNGNGNGNGSGAH